MTLSDLLLAVFFAALFAALIYSYIKKFRQGENCCGTRNVKVKRKRLRRPDGVIALQVEGMHCENCRKAVMEAVNSLEGYAASVDLLTKKCRVRYKNKPDVEMVIMKIRQAGFEVFVKES